MNKRYLSLLCGAAFLCSANLSAAQEPPMPPQEPRPEQMQKMEDDLAAKLKLTDEQKAQARKIHQEGREQMKKMHEEMQALRKANMAEFEKILTPEQKEEFDKIKASHEQMRREKRRGPDGRRGMRKPGKHRGPALRHHDGELPPPPHHEGGFPELRHHDGELPPPPHHEGEFPPSSAEE